VVAARVRVERGREPVALRSTVFLDHGDVFTRRIGDATLAQRRYRDDVAWMYDLEPRIPRRNPRCDFVRSCSNDDDFSAERLRLPAHRLETLVEEWRAHL